MAQKEMTHKEQALEKFASFLQKNRLFFILLVAIILAVIIFFAVFSEVKKKVVENSTVRSEAVERDYATWKTELDETKRGTMETELLSSIDSVIGKYPKTYAAQRCLYIKGLLYWDKKEWENAANAFLSIPDRFPESYLSPISLVNAAASYEENGNAEKAVELYDRILNEYKTAIPDIAKVIFTIGRLEESLGKPDEALKRYTDLVDNYSGNNWTNLARDRIIVLKLKKQ